MTVVPEVQATTFSHLADAHAPGAKEIPNGLTAPDADEARIIVLPNQTLSCTTLSHDAASHSSVSPTLEVE